MQVHVCIPSHDLVCADFMMSLTNMVMYLFQNRLGTEDVTIKIINQRGSLIVDSREKLVEKSLLAGATHILFLDSDMNFPQDALHRLFSRNEPIIAANYVQRCLPTRPNAVTLLDNLCYTNDDSPDIEEVASVGFGLCLIRSEVFDAMPRPWFDTYWYTNEAGKRLIIGEDVYCCRKAKHAGYKVMVDHDLSKEVSHIGTMEYIHPMAEIEQDEV
jgi:hypothetical protein